jgi:hypothetical protein
MSTENISNLERLQKIETQLLAAVHSARIRYDLKECGPHEYANTLKQFADFIIYGKSAMNER